MTTRIHHHHQDSLRLQWPLALIPINSVWGGLRRSCRGDPSMRRVRRNDSMSSSPQVPTSTLSPTALSSTSFVRRSEILDPKFEIKAPNTFAALAKTDIGQKISRLLLSEGGVLICMGAILAAPSRPPHAALHPFMQKHVGTEAFEDQCKRMTGAFVRQIMEHVGARFRRSNVPIVAKGSQYKSGSTYTFKSVNIG